jgi:ubiquinone/menaquinone biosynthesis C-methylase UbiE
VGCGDGYSTINVAQVISNAHFLGIDYAQNMVGNAERNLSRFPNLKDRVSFRAGDVTQLHEIAEVAFFDFVISDRCLINLSSIENQSLAISQIARCLKPGGYYIAIENFVEGQQNLNAARASVGLPLIEIRWHNLFFKEREFILMSELFFENVSFDDFSSTYYFATRVIYSALCKMRGEEPDYNHEIHQFAGDLPCVGQFSPIRKVVLQRKFS